MKTSSAQNIHIRIYTFVIRVIKLSKKVPKSVENNIIIPQVLRSATSMGANDREADGVITKNDFVHKYSIVRKEAKETHYWLNIIADTNTELKPRMNEIINECEEIIKIVTTIIYNTKNNK